VPGKCKDGVHERFFIVAIGVVGDQILRKPRIELGAYTIERESGFVEVVVEVPFSHILSGLQTGRRRRGLLISNRTRDVLFGASQALVWPTRISDAWEDKRDAGSTTGMKRGCGTRVERDGGWT
jgi:hypothetical protein